MKAVYRSTSSTVMDLVAGYSVNVLQSGKAPRFTGHNLESGLHCMQRSYCILNKSIGKVTLAVLHLKNCLNLTILWSESGCSSHLGLKDIYKRKECVCVSVLYMWPQCWTHITEICHGGHHLPHPHGQGVLKIESRAPYSPDSAFLGKCYQIKVEEHP